MGEAFTRRMGKQGTILLAYVDSSRLEQVAVQLRSEGLRIEAQAVKVVVLNYDQVKASVDQVGRRGSEPNRKQGY